MQRWLNNRNSPSNRNFSLSKISFLTISPLITFEVFYALSSFANWSKYCVQHILSLASSSADQPNVLKLKMNVDSRLPIQRGLVHVSYSNLWPKNSQLSLIHSCTMSIMGTMTSGIRVPGVIVIFRLLLNDAYPVRASVINNGIIMAS